MAKRIWRMVKQQIITIRREEDIIDCRQLARGRARKMGFKLSDQTRIVTAVSELVRNICLYAGQGTMTVKECNRKGKKGLHLIFEDLGPGLDVKQAMRPGYSSGKGLGLGLSGSQRLMDSFKITSAKGKGTIVEVIKWLPAKNWQP